VRSQKVQPHRDQFRYSSLYTSLFPISELACKGWYDEGPMRWWT
jgi:hypothetical protein